MYIAAISIDESKEHDSLSNSKEKNILDSQFKQIGEVLSACEAASLQVGIPWLSPTKKIRSLKSLVDDSIEEYRKINLVGVSTNNLELYINELTNNKKEINDKFHIQTPTNIERFGLCIIGAIFGIFCFSSFGSFLKLASSIQVAISFLAGIGFCATVIPLCSEEFRSKSFVEFIKKEIMRRKGKDRPNSTHLRLAPVE